MVDTEAARTGAVGRDAALRLHARPICSADFSSRAGIDLAETEIEALLLVRTTGRGIVFCARKSERTRKHDAQPTNSPHAPDHTPAVTAISAVGAARARNHAARFWAATTNTSIAPLVV